MDTITFKQTVSFLGRNGNFKSIGLNVYKYKYSTEDKVELTPITSKGLLGRCVIEIPTESIPDLIKSLQACIESKQA